MQVAAGEVVSSVAVGEYGVAGEEYIADLVAHAAHGMSRRMQAFDLHSCGAEREFVVLGQLFIVLHCPERHDAVALGIHTSVFAFQHVRIQRMDMHPCAVLFPERLYREDMVEMSVGQQDVRQLFSAGGELLFKDREIVAGVDEKTIRRAFADFVPLPHRMNRIATIDGVEYIDDSKATSLAALEAGVKMSWSGPSGLRKLVAKFGFPWRRRVLLIAGGLPKGDDPKTVLATLTERVKKVYLIGQSAEAFFAAWKGAVDCEICGTMERAVEAARRGAEKGETVLLSPGTASFDQFKSYGERGDVFARLVKEKGQPK